MSKKQSYQNRGMRNIFAMVAAWVTALGGKMQQEIYPNLTKDMMKK